jgi:ABC-type Fe3+ transport system substrate-binding protein
VAHSQLSFAFMHNTDKVKGADVPQTWADLANQKWKGELLMANPRNAITHMQAYNLARKEMPGVLAKSEALGPRWLESANSVAQQLAAGTGSIGFLNYPSHASPLMAKKAPIAWRTVQGPEMTRSAWIAAANGPHPNAGRLLVNFLLSDEGQALYCKNSPGAKTILDPTGARTGCEPLAAGVKFLPDERIPKDELDATIQELKIP